MNFIANSIEQFSAESRKERADVFRKNFLITENTKILDLGSENGSNIKGVLDGALAKPENVYIADINKKLIEEGSRLYGYNPVLIDESGILPFDDGYFDIVYCSSVIEHVTLPKEKVWDCVSGSDFRFLSLKRQNEFAQEIRRLGKGYFVQTPYKYFLIESHTWLPLIPFLPRYLVIHIIKLANMFWVKKTSPDWYLLNKKEFKQLFPEARIVQEKAFGLTKSIMAIKTTIRTN